MQKLGMALLLCWPMAAQALGLSLVWNASLPGDYVQGYIIYVGYSENKDLMWEAAEVNTNSVAFTPVECTLTIKLPSPKLCFRVKAYNNVGFSDFSEPACIQLTEADYGSRGLYCGPQIPLNFHLG